MLLQHRVDGEVMRLALGRGGDCLFCRMWREHRHRFADAGHRLGFGLRCFIGRNETRGNDAIQHTVTCRTSDCN